MRIGILTFHSAHNYGAVLQCYALQEYLRSLGHDAYVIDYRPDYLVEYYKLYKKEHWKNKTLGKYSLKSIIGECLRVPFRLPRYRAFQKFIDNRLRLYPYTKSDDYSDFDAVIFGSDQIWNPKLTGEAFDLVFFGKGISCKKVVYAASNKNKTLTSEEQDFYKKALLQLDYIGVRESTLQQLLQPLTHKPISLNLDPTLLAGNIIFDNLSVSDGFGFKYVLIYEITYHKEVYKIAKKYSKERWCKVVGLNSRILSRHFCEMDQTASPEKWIRYIKFAEHIITTSFHGVAFSILLKKKFHYVRQNNPSDYRIESLLNQLNLMDRIIEMDGLVSDAPIDYEAVHKSLDELRSASVQYLHESLL